VGAVISLDLRTTPDLTGVMTALGGGPVLLEAGEAGDWPPPQPRHPRTALGWNDEHFFLTVVDGRQEPLSIGMTYPELASLLSGLGCTHALNLDGGGSSTLWLDGYIMNSPSDGRERRVANSLIVVANEPEENK
jgi:exopolysaccharide biosynthesis protein